MSLCILLVHINVPTLVLFSVKFCGIIGVHIVLAVCCIYFIIINEGVCIHTYTRGYALWYGNDENLTIYAKNYFFFDMNTYSVYDCILAIMFY